MNDSGMRLPRRPWNPISHHPKTDIQPTDCCCTPAFTALLYSTPGRIVPDSYSVVASRSLVALLILPFAELRGGLCVWLTAQQADSKEV
ncbi:hypothetical protein [Pseudomonas hormoni]